MQSISPLAAADLLERVRRPRYKFEVYDGSKWLNLSNLIPTEGLVGYWPFDEEAGTAARDSSGYGGHGVLTNMDAADHVAGKFSNALDFDGSNDYVSVADASHLDITTAITISAWVKPSSNPAWAVIVSKGTSTTWNNNHFVLGVASGQVTFRWNGKGTVTVDAGDALTVGEWHHVLAVAAAGTTNALKIYIDGELVKQGDRSGDPSPNDQALRIGSDNGTDNFAGLIDEVRIYNRAVTADEITALACPFKSSLLKSPPTFKPAGAGATPDVMVGSWSAEIANPSGIFHPLHPSSEYRDLLRIGRTVRISIGSVINGTTYYWQRFIGYMDEPSFDVKGRSVSLSGCDYSQRLTDSDAGRHWGSHHVFSTVATAEVLGTDLYDHADAVHAGVIDVNSMSGWTAEEPTGLTSETESGGGSTYVAQLLKNTSVYDHNAYIDGVGSVTQGKLYKVTFKYRIIAGDEDDSEFKLKIYATGGSTNLMGGISGLKSWDWTTATFYFTATATGAMRVMATAYDIGVAACTVQWDVLVIKEVTGHSNSVYELPAESRGPYLVLLDDTPISFAASAEEYGWLYSEATRILSFVDGVMVAGGLDLDVYYYTPESVENMVADLLVDAGRYADQATALADMDYTATGVTIERPWIEEGKKGTEAIRMLCERVNYRFWHGWDGKPHFKPAPVLAAASLAIPSLGYVTGLRDAHDRTQLRNHVTIRGIEQGMFLVREDKQRVYLTGEASDSSSIATYGTWTEPIENHLFQDQAAIDGMVAAVLAARKVPSLFSTPDLANPVVPLEVGDTVQLSVKYDEDNPAVSVLGIIREIDVSGTAVSLTCEISILALNVARAEQAQAAENVDLVQAHVLAVDDVSQGQSVESPAVQQVAIHEYDETDDGTYLLVPSWATQAVIECWGAGGNGANGAASSGGGGGGGGGYSKATVTVANGDHLNLTIGSTDDAKNTYVTRVSVYLCRANRGATPTGATGGAGGGTGTAVGDVKYAGGNGASGSGTTGGGGGSSAGPSSAGNAASGQTGGSAVTGGGPGADGGDEYTAGADPSSSPGGGAGGGGRTDSSALGGDGAPGKIRITLTS
jgi:hypothetical protein